MEKEALRLHDTVALTAPLPALGLRRGEVGVIVDFGLGGFLLLEFVGQDGQPYAMPTVSSEQVMKVYLQAAQV